MAVIRDEVLSAVRRSDHALGEQVAQAESLSYGTAFTAEAFGSLGSANCLQDAWLGDGGPAATFDRAEAYYGEKGLVCRSWFPAPAQDLAEMESLLAGHGWQKREFAVMGIVGAAPAVAVDEGAYRILPARAMPRAYQASLEEIAGGNSEFVAAGLERLNDANCDIFVAMSGPTVAGRVSYMEVGDIARLADFFVAESYADQGLDEVLLAHFLQIARRLLPRIIVAKIESADGRARALLNSVGFEESGTLVEFHRPAD